MNIRIEMEHRLAGLRDERKKLDAEIGALEQMLDAPRLAAELERARRPADGDGNLRSILGADPFPPVHRATGT